MNCAWKPSTTTIYARTICVTLTTPCASLFGDSTKIARKRYELYSWLRSKLAIFPDAARSRNMPAEPNIVCDQRGTHKSDVFYEFEVMFDDAPTEAPLRNWIIVPRTPTNEQLRSLGSETYCRVETLPEEKAHRVDECACLAGIKHVTH